MALTAHELTFAVEDISVSELLGLDLENLETTLFSKTFSGNGRYESVALEGDYQYSATVGLQLVLETPTLGEFDFTYPLFAKLELPDVIAAGESFSIGTTNDFYVEGASITGETLNFGAVGLDLLLSSGVSGFSDISVGNALGGSLYTFGEDLLLDPISLDPIRLLEWENGEDFATEILDGVDFEASTPNGEDKTFDQAGRTAAGELAGLTLAVEEALASISINPFEVLDDVPLLAPLDVLTEDYETPEFIVFGDTYLASMEYVLVKPFISGGYGLVQTFNFDNAEVVVTIEVGDQHFTGSLGEAFDFMAPTDLSEPLEGSITYELRGEIDVSYALAPIGAIGLEFLAASASLENKTEGWEESVEFAPFDPLEMKGSADFGRLDLFTPIEDFIIDASFIPVMTKEFEIAPAGSGQDIAFVIDTTGSMSDDIGAVKSQASTIINAIFDPDRGLLNSRVAVVGYNDPTTETILTFTDQPDPEARKTAAIDAINSINVFGGGDLPELTYTGLLRALNGGAGEWREDAVARKIILFGDAPAKDTALASQVYSLAADLNVDIGSSLASFAISDEISLMTFDARHLDPLTGVETVTPVQIFTVAIGGDPSAAAEFAEIAEETGGTAFTAANASEAVDKLLEVLTLPIYAIRSLATSITEGNAGSQTVEFTITRDVADDEAVVGIDQTGTVDAGDVSGIPSSISFAAGEFEKTISVTISGDTDFEADEVLGLKIASVDEPATFGTQSAQITILNDDEETADEDQTLIGGRGDDLLTGGSGNDLLEGGIGNDALSGFGGNDTILGGNGDDVLNGGEGNDMLTGGNGLDSLKGDAGNDILAGGNGNDTLEGGADNDTLSGGNGEDVLMGGEGDDMLSGGNGMDSLEGGAGDDSLTGGNHTDTFVFRAGFGNDTVNDFKLTGADHDILQFDVGLFADAVDLFSHSADTADGIMITSDGGDMLLVRNTSLAQLQAHPEDLHFV